MSINTQKLASEINLTMLSDRHRFRRQLRQLQKSTDPERLLLLAAQIEKSCSKAAARKQALPQPEFPSALPITQRLEEITELISNNQVLILCGETGSGKSTQLPKMCLTLGRGVYGRIAHTQPRRIAARSLASRISSELGRELGDSVGYKVRFHDQVNSNTHIKLLTDGMLLAEIQQDKFLNEYDTIILDEAHERSLNIDFLLGYLKQLLPKRPDLKLIVTSATIDPARFSQHFSAAPVIEVSGRTYPVDVQYRPPEEAGSGERTSAMQQAILDAVDELTHADRGDILIFLSGEREIRETAENLHKHKLQHTEILPLFARMGNAEQAKIFNPGGNRRIILATNVAETSLTVPGIKYVIDTGFARISRYSHRSKIQRLPVECISQASADQRKGRCGRVSDGVCIRLYAEDDYLSRTEYTEAEILRTNLASVILQMKLLGFGEIDDFPFVDAPDSRLIKDGYRVLEEVGAVDGLRKVTRLGHKIARLPVDPRIGRMLLEAAFNACLREVLVIAAALAVQDPRDRPVDKQKLADEAHALFKHDTSDFMSQLQLWDFLEEKRKHLTRRKFHRLCREHFLASTRVQEWHDIHRQIRVQMHDMGYKDNVEEASYEQIHRAVLSGLLSHVGFKDGAREKGYLGARNSRFFIFPGSGLFKQQPKWVVAAELVETTKLYARNVAQVQPEWVESLAGHLVKHHYSEPHWQAKKGQVSGYERVNLFGLTLVARRRINYGPIDPEISREIFIRFALVEQDFHSRAKFWRHNKELIDDIHAMEAKSRRHDILVDEEKIYQFYASRIPAGIYSTPQFEKWLKKASIKQPKLLYMDLADVMHDPEHQLSTAQFPNQLEINGMQLPLEYHFEPGHEADGVTLVVPAAVLNQVTEGRIDWLVPGLLAEKVVTLIKGLPKILRKQFVPVPDHARRCLEILEPSDTPLIQALGAALLQLSRKQIPEDAWNEAGLVDFLRMRIRVINGHGNTLGASRDLHDLQQTFASSTEISAPTKQKNALEQDGLTCWDFAALPDVVETKVGGIQLKGYPALVDQKDAVAIRILDSQSNAARAHQQGLRRLLMLSMPQEIRYLKKNLPDLQQMKLQYAKAPKQSKIEDSMGLQLELVALIVDRTFIINQTDVRDGQVFTQRIENSKNQLMSNAQEICNLVSNILKHYQQIRKQLAGMNQINWFKSVADIQQQLDHLVYQGFLQSIDFEHLLDLPRYLKAIVMRLDKLAHAAPRDQQRMTEMLGVFDTWRTRSTALMAKGRSDERLEEIRWMLEELRVSLFAQELKTPMPVSVKRIKARWVALGL